MRLFYNIQRQEITLNQIKKKEYHRKYCAFCYYTYLFPIYAKRGEYQFAHPADKYLSSIVKIKTSSALYLFLIKHIMQQIIVELTVKGCFFIG